MKDTTIILPIYKLDEEDLQMLSVAVASVEKFDENVKLMIVCPESLGKQLNDIKLNFKKGLEVTILENKSKNTEFTHQVNLGIENCDTEWFSILEIDDEYKESWYKSFEQYRKVYTDIDIFLPIIEDVNVEGKFIGFTNESIWAFKFAEQFGSESPQGYLDKEILMNFQNYQTSGSIYKTEVIKKYGSFKDNIKLTFSYEFFLRMTNNDVKILSIPKIGYRHVNFRENSLFWKYKNDEESKLSPEEVKFWIETAKNEHFFKNKRDINYVK